MADQRSIRVNRELRAITAVDDEPLLWVLREQLGLTGAKFGCGVGVCGACTVLVDGHATTSCVLPIGAVTNQDITTIEGLAKAGQPHPVQRAWLDEQTPQCGYCQSGMILAAVGLLERNPAPSDADIDKAITNICRCGTYNRVRAAIHRAARGA